MGGSSLLGCVLQAPVSSGGLNLHINAMKTRWIVPPHLRHVWTHDLLNAPGIRNVLPVGSLALGQILRAPKRIGRHKMFFPGHFGQPFSLHEASVVIHSPLAIPVFSEGALPSKLGRWQ